MGDKMRRETIDAPTIESEIKNVAANAHNELTDRIQRLAVLAADGNTPHFSGTVLDRAEDIGRLASAVKCLVKACNILDSYYQL